MAEKEAWKPRHWCWIAKCGSETQEPGQLCERHLKKIPKALRERIEKARKGRDWIELSNAMAEARGLLI